jgi:hypothetical protein
MNALSIARREKHQPKDPTSFLMGASNEEASNAPASHPMEAASRGIF